MTELLAHIYLQCYWDCRHSFDSVCLCKLECLGYLLIDISLQ
jgi:hypothetical protein